MCDHSFIHLIIPLYHSFVCFHVPFHLQMLPVGQQRASSSTVRATMAARAMPMTQSNHLHHHQHPLQVFKRRRLFLVVPSSKLRQLLHCPSAQLAQLNVHHRHRRQQQRRRRQFNPRNLNKLTYCRRLRRRRHPWIVLQHPPILRLFKSHHHYCNRRQRNTMKVH